MIIPQRIIIGHLRYQVDVDQAAIDKANAESKSDYAGFSQASKQIIVLRPENPPDFQAETLLHEVIHQCLRVAGCDPDEDAQAGLKDIEEHTIKAMSGPLLDTLRRNPDLVAYLLDTEHREDLDNRIWRYEV